MTTRRLSTGPDVNQGPGLPEQQPTRHHNIHSSSIIITSFAALIDPLQHISHAPRPVKIGGLFKIHLEFPVKPRSRTLTVGPQHPAAIDFHQTVVGFTDEGLLLPTLQTVCREAANPKDGSGCYHRIQP
jgi:hypothetical protein